MLEKDLKGTALMQKGAKTQFISSILIKIGLVSLCVLVLIVLIALMGYGSTGLLYTLAIDSGYGFVDFLTLVSYLGVGCLPFAITFYYVGLHIWAMGKLIENSEK